MPLPSNYLSARAVRTKGGARILPAAVVYESFVDVLAKDADGYSVSHAGAGAAGTTNMTLGGARTVAGVGVATHPRNVVITVTHGSAVVAMSGVITGLDLNGNNLSEAWAVTAGTTSKTFTGKKAFKKITGITEVVAADASANSIVAGDGDVLGLTAACSCVSAVKEVAAGSVVTNGTFVNASTASTDDPRGTYAPNSIPNGTNDYEVWYLSNSPEQSA